MGYRDRLEPTHEIEGKVEYVSAKAFLVEDNFTGVKYWIPKSQVVDRNDSDDNGNILFVVKDWWWKKRHDFEASDDR